MASQGTTWTLPAIFQSAAFTAAVQATLMPPTSKELSGSLTMDARPMDRSQLTLSAPTVVLNPAYVSTASTVYQFDPHTSLLPTASQRCPQTTKAPVGPTYRELSAHQKRQQAQHYLAEARKCSVQGQYKEALTHCHQAVQLSPALVDGYVLRARILFEKGYFEPAFKDLQSAFDHEPSHPEASRLLDQFMDQLPYDAANHAARELGEALMFRDLILPAPPTAAVPCSSPENARPPLPPAPSAQSVQTSQPCRQSPRPRRHQREPLHRPYQPHSPHLAAGDRPPKRTRRSRRNTWAYRRRHAYQQSPTTTQSRSRSPSPSQPRRHRRLQPNNR